MSELDDRLSQAYPPGYKENNKYSAKVHSLLAKLSEPIDPNKIEFKGIEYEWEANELKELHREWFPVRYPDSFFRDLYRKRYHTLLAVYRTKLPGEKQKSVLILGSITYETREPDTSILGFSLTQLCDDDTQGLYIMTLGVVNEVRKTGIAGKLLQQVINIVRANSSVKYVYLDVISYNHSAIRFYQKNGFVFVACKTKYYELFGNSYDAHVYSLFINGGTKAWRAEDYKQCVKNVLHFLNVPCHCYRLCAFFCKKLKNNKYTKIKSIKV